MKRNILNVALAMIMLVVSLPISARAAKNAGVDYQVYDVKTGETTYYSFDDVPDANDGGFSPGYFPNGVTSGINEGISTAAIVGQDNRYPVSSTTVSPYSSTVYIEVYWGKSSKIVSGFMLGPSAVLTAGHCVYDFGENNNGKGLATSAIVVPAKNGDVEPYGRASVEQFIVPTFSVTGVTSDDWAILVLDKPLGNQTGWLGIRWQDASYEGTFVYNTGYPAPKDADEQNDEQSLMLVSTGYVRKDLRKLDVNSENAFEGDWDATGGNSGGPVYINSAETGYTAIGILTAGSLEDTFHNIYPNAFTTATPFTQEMYNLFIQYR